MMENGSDYLRVEGVVKRFGAVSVLKGVDLHVREGEVLGLIGDNGAGKSTLLKTITGFHRPDGGRILIEGDEVNLRSVSQARSLGIQTVYQDLALVNELSVFHNMFLNGEMTVGPFLNNRKMKEKTSQYLADMGVNIPSIDTEVARLSGGQRQAIADPRPNTTPQGGAGHTHDPDRPQLRSGLRRLRPGQPAKERPHRVRQACRRELRRGADRARRLRVPQGPRDG
jgi:ABC-type sugar transport system ATPase subunit